MTPNPWLKRTATGKPGPKNCKGSAVGELSRGEGDYRASASVLLPLKPLVFFRRLQVALDSLGIRIELKIPQAHKAHAGSIPAFGTRNKGLRLMRAVLIF